MPFLPSDFKAPLTAETELFLLRPITIHDVIKDYEAVMSSRDHLWRRFGDSTIESKVKPLIRAANALGRGISASRLSVFIHVLVTRHFCRFVGTPPPPPHISSASY